MRTCLASLKRQTKPKLKGFNSYDFQGYGFQGQSFQGQSFQGQSFQGQSFQGQKLQRFTSKGANY
ncbi:hypothetical protein VCR31J2_1310154 [Vibrio coralliirubri]|uniref:Uncharacterized protein n=1 Tax=Vibrio coralliirubri TaxID=1516159 RepID=A0AA86WQC1_9VIBR|nr:hypothetical protein VCR31J2_1310154 [Vibrio coralliirubri]